MYGEYRTSSASITCLFMTKRGQDNEIVQYFSFFEFLIVSQMWWRVSSSGDGNNYYWLSYCVLCLDYPGISETAGVQQSQAKRWAPPLEFSDLHFFTSEISWRILFYPTQYQSLIPLHHRQVHKFTLLPSNLQEYFSNIIQCIFHRMFLHLLERRRSWLVLCAT